MEGLTSGVSGNSAGVIFTVEKRYRKSAAYPYKKFGKCYKLLIDVFFENFICIISYIVFNLNIHGSTEK
jgi:hypothetical protein